MTDLARGGRCPRRRAYLWIREVRAVRAHQPRAGEPLDLVANRGRPPFAARDVRAVRAARRRVGGRGGRAPSAQEVVDDAPSLVAKLADALDRDRVVPLRVVARGRVVRAGVRADRRGVWGFHSRRGRKRAGGCREEVSLHSKEAAVRNEECFFFVSVLRTRASYSDTNCLWIWIHRDRAAPIARADWSVSR